MIAFGDLRRLLHRGGSAWYTWTTEGRLSNWASIDSDCPAPRGAMNVYFGVHPSTAIKMPTERATIKDIASIGCVFCDYDAKDYRGSRDAMIAHIRDISIKPTVVVSSSTNGMHVYWVLDKPFVITNDSDREAARRLQHGWVQFAGGDKGASDISRVLRVPDSMNFKYDPPQTVKIIFADLSRLYSIEQIESMLPKSQPRVEPKTQKFGRGYAEKALQNESERVLYAADGTRNDRLNRAAFALGRLVASGQVSRTRVEGVLLCSALGAGLSQAEAVRTIASGLDGGENS